MAIYHGMIPPTINFKNADSECDLNYTFNQAEVRDVRYAITMHLDLVGTILL